MATKTIHTLAYKLLVDSSQFEKGMVASRKELNQARRVMREMITPAERIETEFAKLGKLLRKGAIDQDLFNRKAADLREKYDEATGAAKRRRDAEAALNKQMDRGKQITKGLRTAEEKHADTLLELRSLVKSSAISQETYNRAMLKSRNTLPAVIAAKKKLEDAEKREALRVEMLTKRRQKLKLAMLGIAGAATGAALIAGRKVVNSINEQINRMDVLGKASDRLGMSTRALTQFQFIAAKASGFTDEQTTKAFEKMTRRVAEAAAGTGEAVKVLEELKLNARDLALQKPETAIVNIANAMESVINPADRLRMATKLFDDEQAGLHLTLDVVNKDLAGQKARADELGASLSRLDVAKAERVKDAFEELDRITNSFAQTLTIDILPPLAGIIEDMNKLLSSGSSDGVFSRLATSFGIAGRGAVRSVDDLFTDSSPLEFIQAVRKNTIRAAFDTAIEKSTKLAEIQERITKAEKARLDDVQRKIQSAKVEGEANLVGSIGQGIWNSINKRFEFAQSVGQNIALRNMQMSPSRLKKTTFENESITSGPIDSIAAGSSEAFKFLNQTTAIKSIEVKMAEERTKAAKESAENLGKLVQMFEDAKDTVEDILL